MKDKYIKVVFLVLIAITLAFIFIQSILPPEKSSAESDKVSDIVAGVIPPDTNVGGFIQLNLRKLAHFIEFFILGIEVALLIVISLKKIQFALMSIPSAALVALLDETIQIFSERGPAVSDVWIDVFGFAVASLIVYMVYAIICLMLKKSKR